jgi:hypothetical protein
MDEQMAREGQARIRSFKSIGQPKRSGQDRDNLKPGKHRVPMKGTGAGEASKSLGQILQAN